VSTHNSLKALQTDYIDLLLMHWPNPTIPLAETLSAMVELQRAGIDFGFVKPDWGDGYDDY
jgi:aryl-alcohol dehydrogenase-like predicted oxidoreductase